MATKSITKNITIRTSHSALKLARALENAKGKKAQDVVYSKQVVELKKDDIAKLFEDRK